MKQFIERLEEELLIFDNLPIFLNILTTYLFFTFLFLLCSIVVIPVTIRAVFLSCERWYTKKNAVKIEAERLKTLKQDVRNALALHAAKCLKEYPYGLMLPTEEISHVTDLREFLYAFFYNYNKRYNTIIPVEGYVTCPTNRRRSLGDIYLICKYYKPTCTIHEVISNLIYLLEDGYLRASYCNTINRYVFHNEPGTNYIRDSKVEYIGINSFEDIIKVYKDE